LQLSYNSARNLHALRTLACTFRTIFNVFRSISGQLWNIENFTLFFCVIKIEIFRVKVWKFFNGHTILISTTRFTSNSLRACCICLRIKPKISFYFFFYNPFSQNFSTFETLKMYIIDTAQRWDWLRVFNFSGRV